jgi:hypothetical protein
VCGPGLLLLPASRPSIFLLLPLPLLLWLHLLLRLVHTHTTIAAAVRHLLHKACIMKANLVCALSWLGIRSKAVIIFNLLLLLCNLTAQLLLLRVLLCAAGNYNVISNVTMCLLLLLPLLLQELTFLL